MKTLADELAPADWTPPQLWLHPAAAVQIALAEIIAQAHLDAIYLASVH